jgi:hypothetical protein
MSSSGRSRGRIGGTLSSLALALSACGGAEPPVRTATIRSVAGLDEIARHFHDSLTSGDPARVSSVLLSDADVDAQWDAATRPVLSEQIRSERRHLDATRAAWSRFEGSAYRGFCARGAAKLEPGQRGLVSPAEAIDELLVVGRHAGGDWAGWLREIISTSGGFRLAKLPADQPRIGHPELDLWSCEVGRRPGDGRR